MSDLPELSSEQRDEMVYRAGRLVAANIKRARKKKKMTQEQLAFATGLSTQQISRIERAACSPRIDSVILIADTLEVHPGNIFDFTEFEDLMGEYSPEAVDPLAHLG